ncbi:protein ITPRID2 [Cololabis saira]|uniref:protein ITPRID2 n=1 Tax=Cololabis saira TaxID=129043 RepID=UPI002AD2AE7B|nr:protein ITPRID2 [Cololabis saira]
MEAMESSSSSVRRRAWINSSRQWPTVEEPERLQHISPASIADDDVFSDGCFTGKIEDWLLGCGPDVCSENRSQLSFDSTPDNSADDLTLGADASVLSGGAIAPESSPARQPSFKKQPSSLPTSTPRQRLCLPSLNLGHSMASSCFSSSTWKTMSSVSEILQLCAEDVEETLYQLGFGCEEPQVTVRIPPRFFTFPSQAQGINFRLFLDSQIRRIREEDPSLSLASRFRQVQVLTAMANAFYSLYSHVSRTPLQKLSTPEFSFSSPVERIERFRTSIRSEPRSPVERLKDTVNKMCLYAGSPHGSDSTSPQPSPLKRSSLNEVVDVVLKTKTGTAKKLDLGEDDKNNWSVDVGPVADTGIKALTQETQRDTDIAQNGNKFCHKEIRDNEQTDNADDGENGVGQEDLDTVRTSLASSLSGETVIETEHLLPSCEPELRSCLKQTETRTAELNPVVKVTYDLICPQIVERVHKTHFCYQKAHNTDSLFHTASVREAIPELHEPCIDTVTSEPEGNSHTVDTSSSGSLPVLKPDGSYAHYSITVTGWEGEDGSLSSMKTSDSSSASPSSSTPTCKEPFTDVERQYLTPVTHPGLGHLSSNPKQVNSFELEEVHSAGEEDFGQQRTTGTLTSPKSKKRQYKCEVARGDSMQSDSSGYADEEVTP